MNFEDEHYVRIYTRDTKTWLKWGWEGQVLFCLVDRKFDKAGTLDDIEEPNEDLALLTGLPLEVVSVGLDRLLRSGTFELHGTTLVCPKYVAANSTPKSDKLRASESRMRRAAEARTGVTKRDSVSQNVTDQSQSVTTSHDASQAVTKCHSVQINAVQINALQCNAESAPTHESADTQAPAPADAPGHPAAIPEPASKPTRRKPKRPIPDDWTPKPRHLAAATERNIDCTLAAEKFRGHAESIDRHCSDWDRAFDNWLLNERGIQPKQQAFDIHERAKQLREAGL